MFFPKLSDKSPKVSSLTIDRIAAQIEKVINNVLKGRSVSILKSGSNNTIQPYSKFNLQSVVQNWIDNHSSIQPCSRFNLKVEALRWIIKNRSPEDKICLIVNILNEIFKELISNGLNNGATFVELHQSIAQQAHALAHQIHDLALQENPDPWHEI
jgi:hypothetical protein